MSDSRNAMLLACYRSGQMTGRQWAEHLLYEPGLSAFMEAVERREAELQRQYKRNMRAAMGAKQARK